MLEPCYERTLKGMERMGVNLRQIGAGPLTKPTLMD